jgi:hypothetical protein
MKKRNRPESVDVRPKGVMFSDVDATGWKYIRNIHDHKQGKKEGDFHHLHSKFWSEGDEPVE